MITSSYELPLLHPKESSKLRTAIIKLASGVFNIEMMGEIKIHGSKTNKAWYLAFKIV